MANERDQNRDLVLPPDTYLYLQNVGKGGLITVHRGPTVVNQTGQDQPVRYDPATHTYKPCSLEQGVQYCPRAQEGDYVILENPESQGNKFPDNTSQHAVPLDQGRRVIIAGPWCEALWPGQSATVIEGHRLRSNQYVVAMVYNAEEAENNWDKGTVSIVQTEGKEQDGQHKKRGLSRPESFAVGTRIVVKGSEVSFFVPCTGVEVVKDGDGRYVREAVTLEQLEYCCLVDESGKKVYERGPAVVFPKPTQIFQEDSRKRRKFRPIELNRINGIHLKVTANFTDEDIEKPVDSEGKRPQRNYQEGEELFVTGKTLSIYYPREELAVIEYGAGNKKHFSTAVPKGEGRYVIERETGSIKLVKGPIMYLADPRTEIPVRRVLSIEECRLWYPGNQEAVEYNQQLEVAMKASPSGRSGSISEGDWRKAQAKTRGMLESASYLSAPGASAAIAADYSDFEPEEVGDEGEGARSITRGTRYTKPRELTLNTKFDGVPRIEVWPGYAVLVVGSEGARKVVEGPQTILLEYDEKLGFMELSTGKPKNSDKTVKVAYLCVQNNQVSDIVSFESKDHVKGTIKLSLRVNFEAKDEAEKQKWFSQDNYVKYLTDHVRSIIASVSKKKTIAEIKAQYVEIVRDAILGNKPSEGGKRTGLFFEANNMRVIEVEVLDINLNDRGIAQMLDEAQHQVVQTNIEIESARRDLEATQEKERIEQAKRQSGYETQKLGTDIQKMIIADQMELMLLQIENELKKIDGDLKKKQAAEAINDFQCSANLERAKLEAAHKLDIDTKNLELRKDEMNASTNAAVARFNAAKDGLYEALMCLQRDDLAAKLADACTIERFLSGDSMGSSIANLLSLAPGLKAFFDKATTAQENAAVRNRLTQQPAPARS